MTGTALDELRDLIERHATSKHPRVPGLKLVSVPAPSEPTSSIADPALAVVAQGAKRLTIGDRVYDYGAGDYLVVTVDLPVSGAFTKASPSEPFLGLSLTLDPYAIAAVLAEGRPAGSADRTARSEPALSVNTADPELVDALTRLARLLDRPDDVRMLAPLYEKEILWRLLNGGAGELVRQIGTSDGTLARVGGAVRWIRDHYAEAFKVEQLAGRANMSVSTFHRHFRTATTMGPLQFPKKIRLQQARLLLASGRGDVTRVAHDVGYQSPTQFGREYRREYGLPPGQDIRTGSLSEVVGATT
jgi:AraC-like DNA-binding protein